MKRPIGFFAFDEHASITDLVRRTLDARAELLARTALTTVDIAMISENSTDRTSSRSCPSRRRSS